MLLHASTVISRSASSIASYLFQLPPALRAHPLLFALSTNVPSEQLNSLTTSFDTYSQSQSIGCLSSALPGYSSEIACSVAIFDKAAAVPFRSTIRGRAETQVGRWHAMRRVSDNSGYSGRSSKIDDENSWVRQVEAMRAGSRAEELNWDGIWDSDVRDKALPAVLRELSKQDVHTVISLTDNAAQGLTSALDQLSNANKLSLLASSTPFITGRPFTLFQNGKVHSSGAVGIALTSGPRPVLTTAFPGLRAITPVLTITGSEGNLIQELDGANPTKLLMAAIKQHELDIEAAKDDEFCLSVLKNGEPSKVYRIMSGGPTRGTMALESDAAPEIGTVVQLCHRAKSDTVSIPASVSTTPSGKALTFITAPDFPGALPVSGEDNQRLDGHIEVFPDTFMASSENGFLLSRSQGGVSEPTWKSTVTSGLASLTWSK